MAYQFVKVRRISLTNYCGYESTTFDFSEGDGVIPFATFFGPNGCGKTTTLRALQLAANPVMFRGRERESGIILRKSIHDEEYIPVVDMTKKKEKKSMLIDVEFLTDQGPKTVQVDNVGLVRNDLGYDDCPMNGWVYFSDADNPMSTSKFLLAFEQSRKFITFAEEVYGYECELGMPVNEQGVKGYTDFVITKGATKVHFKSMSAGEKKIATLVSDLCQPVNTKQRDIICVDNLELHVYYTRHTRIVDQLRALFPDKQIITTSHSPVVIAHVEDKYKFDIEKYRPDYRLMEFTEEERSVRYDRWLQSQNFNVGAAPGSADVNTDLFSYVAKAIKFKSPEKLQETDEHIQSA